MALHPIENEPRDYAWGRRGAISELLGLPATDRIEAELWFGAHPGAPARHVGAAAPVAADSAPPTLVDTHPDLPFLLKVLAAGEPLSLQAHPDAAQASEGFAREEAAGIPRDAPERNYKDPFPKPELIVALTRFEALCGFRPAAESSRAIAELAVAADAVAESRREETGGAGGAGGLEAGAISAADAVLPLLRRLTDDATVGDAFLWLLGASTEAAAALAAIERGLAAARARFPLETWIADLHPGDPGIAGALLLNHAVLLPGEALFLPAGVVHAYLTGVGLELMAPSDNVLRGGLTAKHVDVAELGRVLQRSASPLPLLEPVPLPGSASSGVSSGVLYDPGAGFSLALLDGPGSLPLTGPAIALCLDGDFELAAAGESLPLTRGAAVLVADAPSLAVSGSGRLAVAR